MSILDKEWKLSQQAQEFFVYTTLGIVPKELFDNNMNVYRDYINKLLKKKDAENDIINENDFSYEFYCAFMCAKVAYGDLNRTLEYKEKYKDGNQEKEKTINAICMEIAKTVLKNGFQNVNPANNFDSLLDSISNYNFKEYLAPVRKKTGKEQEFSFGQIQKWINMTLKYLYLLGLIDSDENLQIPIDSYIIDAAWEIEGLDLPLKPKAKRESKYTRPSDYVMAWSRWTNKLGTEKSKGEYDLLQETIIEIVKSDANNYKSPLDWEHKNWIRIAEKRKGIDFTKKES